MNGKLITGAKCCAAGTHSNSHGLGSLFVNVRVEGDDYPNRDIAQIFYASPTIEERMEIREAYVKRGTLDEVGRFEHELHRRLSLVQAQWLGDKLSKIINEECGGNIPSDEEILGEVHVPQ